MSLFITGSGVSRDAQLRIQDQWRFFIKFFFWGFIDLSSELSILPPLVLFSNINKSCYWIFWIYWGFYLWFLHVFDICIFIFHGEKLHACSFSMLIAIN